MILLSLSAFFSALETSLVSSTKIKLHHLALEGNKRAEKLLNLLQNTQEVLATILIANNLVNILIASIVTKITLSYTQSYGISVATGFSTFFIVIFGEMIPKTFGLKYKERFSLAFFYLFYPIYIIFKPITRIFLFFSSIFYHVLGKTSESISPFATVEEFITLVNMGEKEGIIEKEEKEFINNVIEFTDTEVHEVMVPRIDMVCVSIDDSLQNAWKKIIEEGHSRLPVYEGTIDNIVGIIHAKDVLKALAEEGNKNLKDIMREVMYIPENMKINDLFNEMRKRKAHMAIVVDEYGGTAGLVTLEDLLEELVGEIEDEYDREERMVSFIDNNTILVDAKMNIYELNELLEEYWKERLPETEYDTVGGLVLDILGRVPVRGEEIKLGNLNIKIESMRRQRIEKVRITYNEEKENKSSEVTND
ncbi:MAG: hemolysin family protein [Dictyoglomus sp.]|nr:hemolysin family protein [Dictyoglomus sp.]MCX7941675.1 hemolysin family protein [Dictyoglomaceae bacterium]MDW8188173.1 hemolysin family protein [Dictyoglomus sp.]